MHKTEVQAPTIFRENWNYLRYEGSKYFHLFHLALLQYQLSISKIFDMRCFLLLVGLL